MKISKENPCPDADMLGLSGEIVEIGMVRLDCANLPWGESSIRFLIVLSDFVLDEIFSNVDEGFREREKERERERVSMYLSIIDT